MKSPRSKSPQTPTRKNLGTRKPIQKGVEKLSQDDPRRGMPPLSPSKHPGGAGWGGEVSRDAWLVNTYHRGLDGGVPSVPNYVAPRTPEKNDNAAALQSAKRTPVKQGPTGKRERAHMMSKMLRSLLDELDQEFGNRREEWTKVSQILASKVSRLQDSIRTAQRVTAETITGVSTVMREVLLRSAFSSWDVAMSSSKQRKRVTKNVEWWFKDYDNQELKSQKLVWTVLTWWRLHFARRKRIMKLDENPMERLKALHEGNDLMLRWAFVAWRLCRLMATAQTYGLGAALAMGPNASRLRKLVAVAWLKLGRLRLSKERILQGTLLRRERAVMHRILYSWQITVIVDRNTFQKADFVAKVRNVSKWVITCFHLWARQAWHDATEKEVTDRVYRCSELRREQEKIWKLRVAELENAIAEAKRCKDIQESAKVPIPESTSNFPDWKPPRGKIPGFFRPPTSTPTPVRPR
jgi:hypothetical protein